MKEYQTVIGLEIHCELKTATKIFCGCGNGGNNEPNTNVCPVCLGFPGMLPALNKKAVEYAVAAGLALNCEIQKTSIFDRKNYFYPDLPKAYQITQFYHPICKSGFVEFVADGEKKKVRINRIHLEEDAGKLIHNGSDTLIDLNRGGIPLIEIVTEPDMKSADEAVAFLETLRRRLIYSGVSDCKMEEGTLRFDVNLSVNRLGQPLGTRTEMKNLNSFRSVNRAIISESKRQIEALENGQNLVQETRRWDEDKNKSFSMRSKEDAVDYRYMPDPDIPPVVLSDGYIESIKKNLSELPEARKARYTKDYALPEYDADIILADKCVADFFDACAKLYENKKMLSNWIMSEILRKFGSGSDIISITPENFVKLLSMYSANTVSQNAAKQVFEVMWDSGGDSEHIVDKLGLKLDADTNEVRDAVKKLIAENPQAAADYKSGNTKALAFFVGQIMKLFKGKANPQTANEIIIAELNK